MHRFSSIIYPYRYLFLITLLLGIILNTLFAIIDPLVMKLLLDEALMKNNFRFFILLSAGVVLFGAFIRLGFMAYTLLSQRLKNKIIESLSLDMVNYFYKIPYDNIINQDTGYFISRIYDEPAKIADSIVNVLLNIITAIISIIGALTISLWLSTKLTVFLLIIVPIIYLIANRYGEKIRITSKEENEKESSFKEILGRAIESYRNVNMFNLSSFVHATAKNSLQNFISVLYSRIKLSSFFQLLSSVFLSYGEAIVLISAGYAVIRDQLTIGGLFGFVSAFWKVISSAREIIRLFPELSKLRGYIERIDEFKNTTEKIQDRIISSEDILLNKCSFSYKNKHALRDVSLNIKKGEKILLEGENGTGKSTMANIICGFLKPNKGQLSTWPLEEISASIYPFNLPKGSLRNILENIYPQKEKNDKSIQLPKEFELFEEMDKDFNSLSAGQRKKFEVIMTLLKDAKLYIFDEPTANLDAVSKKLVMDKIIAETQDKTLIVIIHDDAQFRPLFDRVIKLRKET